MSPNPPPVSAPEPEPVDAVLDLIEARYAGRDSRPRIRRALLLLPILALGCGGPSDETLLDELRVLAMVPEAPEIAPMESTVLHTRVVDPAGQGGSALVWSCTLLGETCLEDEEGRAAELAPLTDGRVQTTVSASAALAAAATEEPLPLLLVWALACEDGLCPLIEDVRAGAEVDPALWADPTDWIDELPMQGVSLALSTLYVSTRAADARHAAPALEASAETWTVAAGETLSLEALATGALGEEAKVWAYAEAGGFTMPSERPDEAGLVALDWVAPEEPGEVPLYLVLVDGLGGSALWEGAALVE